MNITDRIRQIEIFSHFTDEQVKQLVGCTSQFRFPAGAMVVKEGDDSRDAYLIESGKIRIQRETPYGVYVLADLEEGQIFGETSFIDGSPRSGTALVLEDSSVYPFNAVALSSLTEKDNRFSIALYWALWRGLSMKLRLTNEKLAHFFTQEGAAKRAPDAPRVATGDFHVSMGAKQEVFKEQKLSQGEIRFLATLSKERRLAPGEVLFRDGDVGDALYVVLEGRVMISKNVHSAGEEALGFMDRGDYFGEMALIDNQPRSADAKAHNDDGAVVLAIPSKVVEGILDVRNKVGSVRLLKLLCDLVAKRLREIDDKIVSWYIFSGGSGSSLEAPP